MAPGAQGVGGLLRKSLVGTARGCSGRERRNLARACNKTEFGNVPQILYRDCNYGLGYIS